jgi:hypothetical protein
MTELLIFLCYVVYKSAQEVRRVRISYPKYPFESRNKTEIG